MDEEPPAYETKADRGKKRTSAIGILKGGKDTMTDRITAWVYEEYKKYCEDCESKSWMKLTTDILVNHLVG